MGKTKKARMTEGPVGQTLVRLTIPMVFGIMGMVLFNLVDTFFVGQLGTLELAAMSFTFPIVLVIGSISMGLGVGASAVISQAIGAGSQDQVQRLTTDSLILSLLVALVVVLVGLLTIDPLFTALGATSEVLPLIREYMSIWYLGVIFVIVPMVGNNAIRATGDTTTPSMVMLVVVVVNVILDPLLIFGLGPFPQLGLMGAAIATVIARAITFLVAIWVLRWREHMLTFALPPLTDMFHSAKQILYIGLPTAGTNLITPITMGIITRLVATFGAAAVAAFGTASRLDMFALVLIMALGSVLAPFVGQNRGARQPARVEQAISYAQQFAFVWGLVLVLVLALVAQPVASLFSDNPDVIASIVMYLWVVPLGYGMRGILVLSTQALNVLGRPLYSAALMLLQTLLLTVPLAYSGAYLIGLRGVFGALAVSYILAGLAAYIVLKRTLRAIREDIDAERAEISEHVLVPGG